MGLPLELQFFRIGVNFKAVGESMVWSAVNILVTRGSDKRGSCLLLGCLGLPQYIVQ